MIPTRRDPGYVEPGMGRLETALFLLAFVALAVTVVVVLGPWA